MPLITPYCRRNPGLLHEHFLIARKASEVYGANTEAHTLSTLLNIVHFSPHGLIMSRFPAACGAPLLDHVLSLRHHYINYTLAYINPFIVESHELPLLICAPQQL